MDETIGVKGGANDRRRSMLISQRQKKKLREYEEGRELAELEKKVKKKQFYTLIKTLPLVIGGGTVQVLYDTATHKKRDKEEENSRWRIKEYDQDITHLTPEEFEEKKRKIITTPTGEKIVVYIEAPMDEKKLTPKQPQNPQEDVSIESTTPIVEQQPPKRFIFQQSANKENKPVEQSPEKKETKPTIGIGTEQIDVESFIDQELGTVDFAKLSPSAQETLGKLKSRKIVEEYENRLKEIRYELRQVIYEYNALADDSERMVLSRDAEIILDRLSEIIDKIEKLKAKIKIDNLKQYDDNYIYVLIEGYLQEFRDKRIVSEIEDSPLYILLEEKLEELDERKGKLSKKVENKKDSLAVKEVDFEELKKRYYSFDQINNQLLEFQYDQNRLLMDIRNKVENAVSETERVKVEFAGLTRQERRLRRILMGQMLFPGLRGARGAATATAAYLYFMRNVIQPNTKTTRYKVITVSDYHSEIQDSINEIDNTLRLLGKTTSQIDKMMQDIRIKFKEYLGVVPECDELLRNLQKVKRDMEEKEYELHHIKEAQEKELEKNDAKVKKRGEYSVN